MPYDVAIAGGGPAGAAAAITLARDGWRVLLAEAEPHRAFQVGEGLAPAARSLLSQLGVLERVLADGHRVSHGTVSAWGSDTLSHHDYVFNPLGDGLLLDRVKFDGMLRDAVREAGADVREGVRLEPADALSESRFLIDAGGRSAIASRRLGAARLQADRLLAFHMCLSSHGDSDQLSSILVESVEDGWWYTALLPSAQRLVVFLGDADLVDRPTLLRQAGLLAKLAETRHVSALIERRGYEPVTPPRATDASGSRLASAAGDRWVAVGDAAQAFDPLSSKGIANALYTGVQGAHAVAAALRGDGSALARYDHHLSEIFTVYLQHAADAYRREQRWPAAPFWQRRHSHATSSVANA